MYKPRGASITILTLLAVSSGFQFDLPPSRETSTGSATQRPRGTSQPSRQTGYTPQREIKGPRTHPDWVRTSALSTDAPNTRNYSRDTQANLNFRDGEIPM